jgi:hypothetical protein
MNKIAGLKIKINERDFPLVRGGKFPKEALRWLAEVERVFTGATKDIIIIRNSSSAPLRRRRQENPQSRKRANQNE